MVEKQAWKEKEAESTPQSTYEEKLKDVILEKERVKTSKKLLKGNQIPFTISRQGIVRSYADHKRPGIALDQWWLFVHEIRQHSGKHVHQGGLTLFVLQGKGFTVVDGKRYDWDAGDLICLSIKKGGVEHQHFNIDDKPSRWLAFMYYPLNKAVGWFMEQKENFTQWKDK